MCIGLPGMLFYNFVYCFGRWGETHSISIRCSLKKKKNDRTKKKKKFLASVFCCWCFCFGEIVYMPNRIEYIVTSREVFEHECVQSHISIPWLYCATRASNIFSLIAFLFYFSFLCGKLVKRERWKICYSLVSCAAWRVHAHTCTQTNKLTEWKSRKKISNQLTIVDSRSLDCWIIWIDCFVRPLYIIRNCFVHWWRNSIGAGFVILKVLVNSYSVRLWMVFWIFVCNFMINVC